MRHAWFIAVIALSPLLAAAADPAAAVEKARPEFAKIAGAAELVKAVKAQNAKGLSAADIDALDKKWQATPGVADFMKPYLEGPCAKALKEATAKLPGVVEAFVMDDKGGLVCSLKKTSDYMQGDEDKWKKSFGPGAEFVDKVKFDDSTQQYSVQVSLPMKDGGKAIGVVMLGLSVEAK